MLVPDICTSISAIFMVEPTAFFETVSTPTQLHFYKQKHKYRELEIAVDEIGLTEPYRFLKNFDDTDSLELIAWTQDEAIDYVDTPDTPIGEGYVKLKRYYRWQRNLPTC